MRLQEKSIDYFISDLHFGHKNIIEHCDRGFANIEEMDLTYIDAWNAAVKGQDRVFILGDFSFYHTEQTQGILDSLKGQKFFVKGNHDSSKMLAKLKGLAKVVDYLELKYNLDNGSTQRVCLSHFPMLSWHQRARGAWHFHGHCHGSLVLPKELENARIFDVGVDNIFKVFSKYSPVSLGEITEHLKDRIVSTSDHHRVVASD
jgi:calcineurin-like phosphoesterase family protein